MNTYYWRSWLIVDSYDNVSLLQALTENPPAAPIYLAAAKLPTVNIWLILIDDAKLKSCESFKMAFKVQKRRPTFIFHVHHFLS